MLRRTTLAALFAVALASAATARPAPATPALLAALPAGDAIATVDVATLVNTTLPTVLADKPESRQKLEANIASIKTDYGVDLRQVRSAAISSSLGGRMEWVAALDGPFDALARPEAAAAAADRYVKLHPSLTVKTESREGVAIYVFSPATGAGDATAVAILDATTALYGAPDGVRKAIDAKKGKAPNAASNATLVAAYGESDASAVVRYAAIVPAELTAGAGSDPFAKSLAAIKSIFGSAAIGADKSFNMKTTARTASADDAKSVRATLESLVAFGRQLTGNKPDLAALVDLVSVTTAGNDVLLSIAVPSDKLDPLFRTIDKESRGLAR
jgi:hypothetical protein